MMLKKTEVSKLKTWILDIPAQMRRHHENTEKTQFVLFKSVCTEGCQTLDKQGCLRLEMFNPLTLGIVCSSSSQTVF